MSRSKQQLLGTAAPGRTTAAYRFERETLKRGGPLAVQGKRWTKKPKPPKTFIEKIDHLIAREDKIAATNATFVLANMKNVLKKMPQ